MSLPGSGRVEGRYADGRTYVLPRGWMPVPTPILDVAVARTWEAVSDNPGVGRPVSERLAIYYSVDGYFAGATFCEVEPNAPFEVTAADLWAVSSLGVGVSPREGRRLLEPGRLHTSVNRHLRRLEVARPLTDLSDDSLDAMYDLYVELGGVGETEEASSNRWVLAAALCARKRPELFPARDALVCAYLSGGRSLSSDEDQLGRFANDLQVSAHLVSDPAIRARLRQLQRMLDADPTLRLDDGYLRLLDTALWTHVREDGVGAALAVPPG